MIEWTWLALNTKAHIQSSYSHKVLLKKRDTPTQSNLNTITAEKEERELPRMS